MGFWIAEPFGEASGSTPHASVSQLTGEFLGMGCDGFSRHQAMKSLTLCFLSLALATGISVAATPDGHNPLREDGMALPSQH